LARSCALEARPKAQHFGIKTSGYIAGHNGTVINVWTNLTSNSYDIAVAKIQEAGTRVLLSSNKILRNKLESYNFLTLSTSTIDVKAWDNVCNKLAVLKL